MNYFGPRTHLRRIFYSSLFGLVVAVTIREKFDGVAFIFFVLALLAFVTSGFIEMANYDNGLQQILADIDRCQNDTCGNKATASVEFASTSVRVCEDCIEPMSEWVNAKLEREHKYDIA